MFIIVYIYLVFRWIDSLIIKLSWVRLVRGRVVLVFNFVFFIYIILNLNLIF